MLVLLSVHELVFVYEYIYLSIIDIVFVFAPALRCWLWTLEPVLVGQYLFWYTEDHLRSRSNIQAATFGFKLNTKIRQDNSSSETDREPPLC